VKILGVSFRVWGSNDASIFARMSAGVFLPPTPTCFADSEKDFTIASSKSA